MAKPVPEYWRTTLDPEVFRQVYPNAELHLFRPEARVSGSNFDSHLCRVCYTVFLADQMTFCPLHDAWECARCACEPEVEVPLVEDD